MSCLGMLITICRGFVIIDMSFYVGKFIDKYLYELTNRVNPSTTDAFAIKELKLLNENATRRQ